MNEVVSDNMKRNLDIISPKTTKIDLYLMNKEMPIGIFEAFVKEVRKNIEGHPMVEIRRVVTADGDRLRLRAEGVKK